MSHDAIRSLLEALAAVVDRGALEAEMRAYLGDLAPTSLPPTRPPPAPVAPRKPQGDASPRFLLQDILDDSIVGAKAGDKSFPLRVLFSELATRADDELGFVLLCALNVYFRVEADDEVKLRLGHEISRMYYRFMDEARPEGLTPVQVSGLVAALLSTELQRVRLEAVDHAGTFDSAAHERAPGSDSGSATLRRPLSFLCRVPQTGMVRIKAQVLT
jgi:hypothetical protein